MQQTSTGKLVDDERQAGGHRAKARGAAQKGQEGATEKPRWCREKKDKTAADVGIWVTWCRFLSGTHVRPNYRTQAARSEATANQKHAFQSAGLPDLFVS